MLTMKSAMDWVEIEKPLVIKPQPSGRTQLQIVTLVEDTWLAPYLIPVDVYICPSEAMVKMRKGGTQ